MMVRRATRRALVCGDGRLARAPRIVTMSARRAGAGWLLTATSDLGAGACFYWFIDGRLAAQTSRQALSVTRQLATAVEVLASRHNDLDPTRWAARHREREFVLEWVRPTDGAEQYRIEQAEGSSGGSWTALATVPDERHWLHRYTTPRLSDLSWWRFRVVPITAGNDGTPLEFAARFVGGRPDAPAYDVTYNAVNGRATVTLPTGAVP